MVTVVKLLIFLLTCADGTHFRGAMFWWTASPNDPRKVDLSFRVAWRRTYRESTFCDLSTISNKLLIGPPDGGDVLCTSGCYLKTQVIGDMLYYCTDYSQIENWSSGERTYSYLFPSASKYTLGWSGKGWVEGLQQGRDAPWAFKIYLDLQPRSDTLRTNSSPRTAMTTIISMQQGCQHSVTIPREDPDGDEVRCRWAEPLRGECGGICEHDPAIQLNRKRCEVTFPRNASLGWYALAIQLEDFTPNSVEPLSSVPLQFLVQIYQSPAACDALPVFVSPTPEDSSCLLPPVGRTSSFLIVVRTKDRETKITDVRTTSTDGMRKSAIHHTPDTRDYYVNVTWSPAAPREHIYCFTAIDSVMVSTPQRCIYLAVDPIRPRAVSAHLLDDRRTILIRFDMNVFLPYTPHFLWVYNRQSVTVLFIVDTSTSGLVETRSRDLYIMSPSDVTFKEDDVFIIMEDGAVRGKARCAESFAVKDADSLLIKTGVTSLPGSSDKPATSVSTLQPTDGLSSTASTCCPDTSSHSIATAISVAARVGKETRDYTWLIVLVLGTVLLVAAAILVAVFIKKGTPSFLKTPASGAATGGAAAGGAAAGGGAARTLQRPTRHTDFSDINVKYR